jgi:hypothetical protein
MTGANLIASGLVPKTTRAFRDNVDAGFKSVSRAAAGSMGEVNASYLARNHISRGEG